MIDCMGSIKKFNGRRVYLTLGAGALTLSRADGLSVIPLEAIAEVRAPELPDFEIVLTDGEVHHVEGVDPAATETFAATLTGALPGQRDPAGSALVTMPGTTPVVEGVPLGLVALAVPVLAYVGYAIWVGVTYGARVIGVLVGAFVLLLGLALCALAAQEVARRIVLGRRGVTVEAERTGWSEEGPMYYYNDTAGVPHPYVCRRDASTVLVTYDPLQPDRAVHHVRLPVVIGKVILLLLLGALLLWLGAWAAFGLFW